MKASLSQHGGREVLWKVTSLPPVPEHLKTVPQEIPSAVPHGAPPEVPEPSNVIPMPNLDCSEATEDVVVAHRDTEDIPVPPLSMVGRTLAMEEVLDESLISHTENGVQSPPEAS